MTKKAEELVRSWELHPYEIDVRFSPRLIMEKMIQPDCAYNFLIDKLSETDLYLQESIWLLPVNQSNYLMGYRRVAMGGLANATIPLALILSIALKCRCAGFIIVHNHPSGNLKPSKADKEITKKLQCAAKMVDLNFLDHLIISEEGFYSFACEGLK
ncbi:MAG: JAB domain-containing protein [Bacteroidota bacterium]